MKTETRKSTTASAYGKTIDPPIEYTYSWQKFDNPTEVRNAGLWPSEAKITKMVNNERQAKERQAELTATWTAAGFIKPTVDNDDQFRLKDMFKNLMSSKLYTEDEARALAASTLKLEWEDEDEG